MGSSYYEGREQSGAKHEILKTYLEPFCAKVFSAWPTINFIDAFSGPWESRDPVAFSDTSFGIAIQRISAALEQFPERRARLVFNERDKDAFVRLQSHVSDLKGCNPRLELFPLNGTFAENVQQIAALTPGGFRLIFVDPKGWNGFPIEALRPLAGRQSEIILTFMSDHINRFMTGESAERERWAESTFGKRIAESLAGPHVGLEELKDAQMTAFRQVLGYQYCCAATIDKVQAQREHFSLLYATNSPHGPEVLRTAQIKSLSGYDQTRQMIRSGGQATLPFLDPPGSFSEQRRRDLDQLDTSALALARNDPGLDFLVFAARLQERRLIRQREIKDALVGLGKQGHVEQPWRDRGSRDKPKEGDRIVPRIAT